MSIEGWDDLAVFSVKCTTNNIRKQGEDFEIELKDSHFQYQGYGNFLIRDEVETKRNVRRLGMICSDTGITPFFQMTQEIAQSRDNNFGLSLIQESRTTQELYFEEDFVEIEQKGALFYYPVLQQPPDTWSFGKSPISQSHLSHFMPHPEDQQGMVMLCGPRQFRDEVLKKLEKLSYKKENILIL